MPAQRLESTIRVLYTAVLVLLAGATLAGCAGSNFNAGEAPAKPDESALAPAEQALAKAQAAQADDFAPQTIDAARRRITDARDIVYAAARADRGLSDAERKRVEQLVDGAKLDARSALVETQAKAVANKIADLQPSSSAGPTHADAAAGPGSPQPSAGPSLLDPGAPPASNRGAGRSAIGTGSNRQGARRRSLPPVREPGAGAAMGRTNPMGTRP